VRADRADPEPHAARPSRSAQKQINPQPLIAVDGPVNLSGPPSSIASSVWLARGGQSAPAGGPGPGAPPPPSRTAAKQRADPRRAKRYYRAPLVLRASPSEGLRLAGAPPSATATAHPLSCRLSPRAKTVAQPAGPLPTHLAETAAPRRSPSSNEPMRVGACEGRARTRIPIAEWRDSSRRLGPAMELCRPGPRRTRSRLSNPRRGGAAARGRRSNATAASTPARAGLADALSVLPAR